jgi:Uma2 family endonuclease
MAAGSTFPPVSGVSVEEYLSTSYKPACDYLDGALRQKPMPTRKHSLLQWRLLQLINLGFPEFLALPELTVRMREGRYLVPDVVAQRRELVQDPYPTTAVHLCIEILSPDDRMSEMCGKCEECHAWGVNMAWIVDPETERAWEYRSGERPREVSRDESLTAEGISIPLSDVFSVLHVK